jgi:pyrroline-5-carboxylate reductase
MLNKRIGWIGAGQMATALAMGVLRGGGMPASAVIASDRCEDARKRFARATGGRTTADNLEVVDASDVVVLAVKPQQLGAVLGQLHGRFAGDKLAVSVAAGVRLAVLEKGLGSGARVVRVMPNTPCLVGQGASAYALGSSATAADGEFVRAVLGMVGLAVQVDERLLDAVTGLSGSGPAFAYVMIEALADGGVGMGLPRATALQLAAQTLRGAAEMVLATGEHPGVLKDRVASPGGTTIAGLAALESAGLRAALIAAVEAATRRSIELASDGG